MADDERLDALMEGLERRAPVLGEAKQHSAPRAHAHGRSRRRSPGSGAGPQPDGLNPTRARAGCRPPSAAAVLAAELQRLGGRLGGLEARARSGRQGGQENRRLPALCR